MREYVVFACFVGLTSLALAQQAATETRQPSTPSKFGAEKMSAATVDDLAMKDTFEAKIKTEWEALKHQDRKTYADLLAEDYQGVEVDGRGERNKVQALNELSETNVFTYTLWGFKLIPAGPDAALVIYEVTMEFPPKSVVRYSRVYISEFWLKRGGQWKLAHYQETHVK